MSNALEIFAFCCGIMVSAEIPVGNGALLEPCGDVA